jgi:hypothetical protein
VLVAHLFELWLEKPLSEVAEVNARWVFYMVDGLRDEF